MIKILSQSITVAQLEQEAQKVFGEMVKAVVDIEQGSMAINGELHSDEEALLLQNGSQQKNLWGINLYPSLYGSQDWLEFDSMINLRPSGGNRSRGVDDPLIRQKITAVISKLVIKK